jgi:thymidylate kinase
MPTDKFEFRISYKKLLIGLLVTIVPISLAGLYAITQSDRALESTIGTHFKIIAESTATEVSRFIHDRVISVGAMAAQPVVVDAVTTANRAYQGMSDNAVTTRIQKIEKEWPTPAADPIVRQILSSPASVALRRYMDLDKRFLRITLTDERGATIAATHKTLDYFQADEDFWQAIDAQGRGAVNLTDILYDDVTKSNYIGVGVPVMEPNTNRFIGAMDALIDVSSLFPVVNRAHPPLSLRASLIKDDGTVISSPDTSLSMKVKSQAYAAVQDALTSLEGLQTGYMVVNVEDRGRLLIGFADTGLKQDYRNLGWTVLVTQNAYEAFAALHTVGRLTAFLALMGLAMVTLLAVYFSLHRAQRFTGIEEAERAEVAGEETEESRAASH